MEFGLSYSSCVSEEVGSSLFSAQGVDSTSFSNNPAKLKYPIGNSTSTKGTLSIRKYQDIIHEAKSIAEFTKMNPTGKVFTDNLPLKATIICIINRQIKNQELIIKDFWIKTAFCMFSLNKSKYIDVCSSHPLCYNEFRGPTKSLSFKTQIAISLEKAGICSSNHRQKHKLSSLINAHSDFINKISNIKLDNLILSLNKDTDKDLLDIYEYIDFLKISLESEDLYKFDSERVLPLEKLSSAGDEETVWICGLSDQYNLSLIDVEHITRIKDPVLSYSKLQNSSKHYPNPLLKDIKEHEIEEFHSTTSWGYSDPCPKLELRKTSFAINHITKLLNNPYQFYIEAILGVKQYSFHQNHTVGILIHAVFEECIKNNPLFSSLEEMNQEIYKIIKHKKLSKMDELIVSKKIYLMSKTLWPIIMEAKELYPEKEGVQEISHNGKTYLLHGRADLIYKDKNNSYGVIDFKTGSIPSWINILNGSAPQISVEILMLKFGGFIEDQNGIKITKSGFIWPKGFLEVKQEDVIKSSIDGIKKLIETFWIEQKPYIHTSDFSPYKIISRDFKNEAN